MSISLCVHMCGSICGNQKRALDSFELELRSCCESPNVDYQNQILILCESRLH